MSGAAFDRARSLDALGIEHGLGTRRSADVRVERLELARQVHGTRLVEAPVRAGSEADALFTREPGVAVGVHTADCVPILLVDPRGRGVAAIHAGWRGSAAGIAFAATRAFARAIDADPSELLCVLGPHIGPCCYEVDEPVRERIAAADAAAFQPARRAGHYMLDLEALNARQLERAGARPERIERVGACTACDVARYASYRRDGTAGRMLHYVRLPLPDRVARVGSVS